MENCSSKPTKTTQYSKNDLVFNVDFKKGRIQYGKVLAEPSLYDENSVNIVLYPNRIHYSALKSEIGLIDRELKPGTIVKRINSDDNSQLGICQEVNLKADVQICDTNYVVKNVEAKRLNTTNWINKKSLVYFDDWIGKIYKTDAYLILKSSSGVAIEFDASKWFYYYRNFNADDPYFYQRLAEDSYNVGKSIVIRVADYKEYEILTPWADFDPEEIQKYLIESLGTDGVHVKWLFNISNDKDIKPPNTYFGGDDLKKLKYINFLEQFKIKIGHTSYLTICDGDEIISKSKWDKEQEKKFETILKEKFKNNDRNDDVSSESSFYDDTRSDDFEYEPIFDSESPKFLLFCGSRITWKSNYENCSCEVLSGGIPSIGEIMPTEVLTTYRNVTVAWQDGTIESGICSTELHPISKENNFFPGDIVVDQNKDISVYGIIQSIDNDEKIARVKWFKKIPSSENHESVFFEETEKSIYLLSKESEFDYKSGALTSKIHDGKEENNLNERIGVIINSNIDNRLKVWWLDGHTSVCCPTTLIVFQIDNNSKNSTIIINNNTNKPQSENFLQRISNGIYYLFKEKPTKFAVGIQRGYFCPHLEFTEMFDVIQNLTNMNKKQSYIEIIPFAPSTHKFYTSIPNPENMEKYYEAIRNDHLLLRESLPKGIWIKFFQNHIDLISVMIEGPENTPYENCLFLFDFQWDNNYPENPPQCRHDYNSDLNPIFSSFEDISLDSLKHSSENISLLQYLIYIKNSILTRQPFFTKESNKKLQNTERGNMKSRNFNEKLILNLIKMMTDLISLPSQPFQKEILQYFKHKGKLFNDRLLEWIQLCDEEADDEIKYSTITKPKFPLLPLSQTFGDSATDLLNVFNQTLESNF